MQAVFGLQAPHPASVAGPFPVLSVAPGCSAATGGMGCWNAGAPLPRVCGPVKPGADGVK